MAAVFLAEELDIREVLVPPFPGTFSAWGMLQTDLRHDLTTSFFQPVAGTDLADVVSRYEGLESGGQEALKKQGVPDDRMSMQRTADMRYVGQEYTINVAVKTDDSIDAMVESFHAAHERRYGHCNLAAPVEFVNLRIAAFGHLDKYEASPAASASSAEPTVRHRNAVFNGKEYDAQVFNRDDLAVGFTAAGPLIVEEQSATTIVPPGWQLTVDERVNLIISQ